jgi:excinuclease ABC subunit C
MRKKFGILLNDAKPEKLLDGQWRLYGDARAEIFAGHNETTREEYGKRVEDACLFLEGRAKGWLAELREEMQKRAEAMDFERAAELRDLADSLSKTIKKNRKFTRAWPKDDSGDWGALEKLGESLDLVRPPHTIECFDISHVSGTFVVASMVRFVGGKPDKRGYRRFKIKSFIGNDDFRAMEEVVGRRYSRLLDEGQSFPELVVIDGGLGQVMSSMKAFASMEADPPPLIGLAKREETIVFHDDRGELKLKASDPALRLLQRVRDEAHRFANRFNADLRSKKIKESILDDFPGLGKVRRSVLLENFDSIEKMRKASLEELSAVEGFGAKMAGRLFDFLKTGKTE